MADTSKILSFRHPSQAGLLLESLLQSLELLPDQAHRITERSDLPSGLQRLVMQARQRKSLWSAWTRGNAIWFFAAEVVTAPHGPQKRPALKISGYNARARLTSCGVWVHSPVRGWQRCAL